MKLMAAALAALLVSAISIDARAQQNIDVATANFATWTIFGAAEATSQTANGLLYQGITLTPTVGGNSGAAFAPTPVTLDFNQSFGFHFNFYIRPGTVLRGDGMTFALTDTRGLGGAGSGLGYEGLSQKSVAFAIDTFHFSGDPVSPSLQILAQGSVAPLTATETGLGDSIRDPFYQWHAFVDYVPSGNIDESGTLTGRISRLDLGDFSVSQVIDSRQVGLRLTDQNTGDYLGNTVYYGFTAANGLADDGHFVTSAVPVPEADTWAMLVAGLGLIGFIARRRRV